MNYYPQYMPPLWPMSLGLFLMPFGGIPPSDAAIRAEALDQSSFAPLVPQVPLNRRGAQPGESSLSRPDRHRWLTPWEFEFLFPDPQGLLPDPPPLVDYPSFNSQRLDQQLLLYSEYLATVGVPDVLIVGSSRALQGVDPMALQKALVEQGYPQLKIYNFSINGATAQVMDLVMRRILLPNQLPKLVIWADGSRAVNSGRADITYNGIAASEGYKRLASGDRPIPNLQPLALFSSLFPPTQPSTLAQTVADLNGSGFQSVTTRFNPATYYQQFPRVSGRYDSNYVPFQLDGEQTRAISRLAIYMRDRQIPLIFVNLPLTQEYLDPTRLQYEQQFQQHMQRLARQHGFMFRDLLRLWPQHHHYFADPSHLNQWGASAVASYLAAEPTLPWSMFQLTE